MHQGNTVVKDFTNFSFVSRLFSKDLWSSLTGTANYRSSLQGTSYLSGICTNGRYSLIEDYGVFANILVILIVL